MKPQATEVNPIVNRRRLADDVIDDVLARVDHLCARINDLAQAQAQTLALMQQHIDDSSAWRSAIQGEVATIKTEVATNTDITAGIANLQAKGRLLARFASWCASSTRTAVIWLGGLGAGAYGIWQIVAAWRNGGPGPHP